MIFFYTSSANSPWYVPALLLIASLVLQSGLSPFSGPLGFFLGSPLSIGTWNLSSFTPAKQQHESSALASFVCITIAVAASFIVCKFFIGLRQQTRRHGIRRTFETLRATPWRQWPNLWNVPDRTAHNRRSHARRPTSHQARFEQVSKRVQQLPTEVFMSKKDLSRLPLHDLKVKLKEMGMRLRPGESIDREEAINLALEKGGSSSVSCGICCEDYLTEDVLRKLPKCGHRFHLECIDRWLLSSTDYSQRPSSCPMCNAEL